jgi:hypothetical protein
MIMFLLLLAGGYLACGLLFAIPFVIKGVDVVDEGAHGSGIGFRLIIIPGVTVFWPLLLKKWLSIKKEAPRD